MDSKFRELHKSRAWREKSASEKRQIFKNTRAQKRQTLFLTNRGVDENEVIPETPETRQAAPKRSAVKKTPFAVKFARWKKNKDDAKQRAKREKITKPPFIRSVCPGSFPPLKPLERRGKFNPPAKVKPLQFAKLSEKPPQIDTNFNFPTTGPLTRARAKFHRLIFD
ncbi:hypothetical protein DMENIID0001_063320 [Sergentomyia squamirostris]